MLSGPTNTHLVINDEVLGLATNCMPINIQRLVDNHREGGEVTGGVEGQSLSWAGRLVLL